MESKELIRQCLQGNPEAQKLLFKRFVTPMTRLCIRYLKDPDTAKDTMMEGFMKIFDRLNDFEHRGDASADSWIRKIMINECLMKLRQNRNRSFMDITSTHVEAVDIAESKLSAEEILNIVDSLPNGYRIVFNLYAIDGYSHQEIAAILGISESASRSQLTHARTKLKELLRGHGWNE